MTNFQRFYQGVSILFTYTDADIDAEHGTVYAGPNFEDVTPDDAAELEKLGWHKSDQGCWGFFT